MNLDEIRDTLFKAMEEQNKADIAANEANHLLGQQKIMYNSDARGTLYSGQPTWERAQLATQTASNLANINSNYLKNKMSVWDNITKTMDQINSYNKAAAAMSKATSNLKNGGGSTASSYMNIYNELLGGD